MRFLSRLLVILWTVWRFGLDDLALSGLTRRRFQILRRITRLGRRWQEPRGVRLRQALEHLGPIFVKFGQVLSTRRDLLPEDVALELAKLQDRVPPFPAAQARRRRCAGGATASCHVVLRASHELDEDVLEARGHFACAHRATGHFRDRRGGHRIRKDPFPRRVGLEHRGRIQHAVP